MPHKFRIISIIGIILAIVMGLSIAIAQQSNVVTITPQSGPVGTVFDILVTDLDPNKEYQIAFVFEQTNSTVFSTRRTTLGDGSLVFNITAEPGDEIGQYVMQIKDGETVVAQGQFTLTDGSGSSDDSVAPPQEPQQNQGVQTTNTDNISISPRSAVIGSIHTIAVRQLQPEQTLTVSIINDGSGEVVYSKVWTANESGLISFEIFAEDDDDDGLHVVTATDLDGNVVARGEFMIEGKTERNAAFSITPESASSDTEREIEVTGLIPFEDVGLDIIDANGESVFSNRKRADVNGDAVFVLSGGLGLADGTYQVVIEADETVLIDDQIVIGDGTPPAVTNNNDGASSDIIAVNITPSTGEVGTNHEIQVSGLAPQEQVTLDVTFGGTTVYTTERSADADGSITLSITSEEGDAVGQYGVNVLRNGQVVASSGFIIQENILASPSQADESGVEITVIPPAGPVGTNHRVEISGLEPNETITVNFSFDGQSIYSTERTADASGLATITIASEEGDETGQYDVNVVRNGEVIAENIFTIGDEVVDTTGTDDSNQTSDNTTDTTAASDVEVTINPPSGAIGTLHTITASGLEPSETVTFDILLDGNSVFSTQRTANAEGIAILDINSEEGDPEGVYTVTVARGEIVVAQGEIGIGTDVVTSDDAQEDTTEPEESTDDEPVELVTEIDENVSLTVTPERGVRGTSHTVLLQGLNPNEAVTINILFGSNFTEYTTARTADGNGNVEFNIATEPSDGPGSYAIDVVRNNTTIIAEGSFIVDRGEPINTVSAEISPTTGAVGTSHEILLWGLEAQEDVTVELALGDTIVYATQRIADNDGVVRFNVATEEGDSPGTYEVIVTRGDEKITDVAQLVITGDDVVSGPDIGNASTLPFGETVETTFSGTTTVQNYSFDAQAGQIIDISVNSNDGIDTFMTLIGPDNSEVAFDDDSGSGFDPEINQFIVERSGTYLVRIEPYTAGESGNIRVTLTSDTAQVLEGAQQIRLNDKQSVEALVIDGQEGDNVLFTVDVISGNAEDIFIVATQNGNELMRYNTTGIGGSITLGFAVPENGTITIRVDNVGLMNVVLEMELR